MRRIKIAGLLTIAILLGCTEKPVESEPPAAERVLLTLFEGQTVYAAQMI